MSTGNRFDAVAWELPDDCYLRWNTTELYTTGEVTLEHYVPEPAAMTLLGIGALAMLRRRGRQQFVVR
jgi:hypothetical protein